MNLNTRNRISSMVIVAFSLLVMLVFIGCSERDLTELELASADDNPIVFEDEFQGGLDYAAFEFSFYDAFTIDETVAYTGTASMKVSIPALEWAGGSFYTHGSRDLSNYNALTFYAKASRPVTLGSAGFGIGILDDGPLESQLQNLPLTTEWTQIVIPVPNPARMINERGMFWYSMGASDEAVDIWFDEVKYAIVSGITNPRPVMTTRSVQALVGDDFSIPGTRTVFNISGQDYRVYHTGAHFSYYSSDDGIAEAEGGTVTAVSLGAAMITAKLGSTDVQGTVTAQVVTELTAPIIFIDAIDEGLDYGAFESSHYDAMTIDEENGVDGSAAVKYTIPNGLWAGGAFFTGESRDLSSFNALVFDAKATEDYTLSAVGYGVGMEFGTPAMVEVNDVQLTTEWTRVIIPIPNADHLTAENGMFWFSAADAGEFWFDNIQFTNVEEGVITNPRPVMSSASVEALLNEIVPIEGTATTFDVDGTDMLVTHTNIYFTYTSSDENVATAVNGVVTAVGGGSATITGQLIDTEVDGEITVTVIAPPSEAAPEPTQDQADVISVYSDSYTDIEVTSWLTDWSFGPLVVFDQVIVGDNVKAYTGFNTPAFYGGIDFTANPIDATTPGMTHFHMDVFAPAGTQFGIKIVDFGANGAYGGGDDSEHTFILNDSSDPLFANGQWVAMDIPLTEFGGMNFGNVSQFVITGTNTGSVWVDNIYFHK